MGARRQPVSVAEECLTKAIASDPNAVSARIELAATYRDMGQPDRSLPLLDKAVVIAEREGKQRQAAEARTLLSQLRQTHSESAQAARGQACTARARRAACTRAGW